MDQNETYSKWKAEKANIDPTKDFSSKIMEHIQIFEKKRTTGVISNLLSQINFLPTPLMRAAFVLGCMLLGIFRVYYISANILLP